MPISKRLEKILAQKPDGAIPPYWDAATLVGYVAKIAASDAQKIRPKLPQQRIDLCGDTELGQLLGLVYHSSGFVITLTDRLSHRVYLHLLCYYLFAHGQRIHSGLRNKFAKVCQENSGLSAAGRKHPYADWKTCNVLVQWICTDGQCDDVIDTIQSRLEMEVQADWPDSLRHDAMKEGLNNRQQCTEDEALPKGVSSETFATAIWKPLHSEFGKSVSVVRRFASKKTKRGNLDCVHIHPRWVEATDNFELGRNSLETGMAECLVPANGLNGITALNPTSFFEDDSRLYFRNDFGTILTCIKRVDEFPEMTDQLEKDGAEIGLPRELSKVLQLLTPPNSTGSRCYRIQMIPKKTRVKMKVDGKIEERELLTEYEGPPIRFRIDRNILAQICDGELRSELTPHGLKASWGAFEYLTAVRRGRGQSE